MHYAKWTRNRWCCTGRCTMYITYRRCKPPVASSENHWRLNWIDSNANWWSRGVPSNYCQSTTRNVYSDFHSFRAPGHRPCGNCVNQIFGDRLWLNPSPIRKANVIPSCSELPCKSHFRPETSIHNSIFLTSASTTCRLPTTWTPHSISSLSATSKRFY